MLNLKSSHKPIKEYYKILQELDNLGVTHELAVKGAFEDILKACCSQLNWTYIAEQTVKINNNNIRPDGMIQRQDTLKHGYWEAKGNNSDLERAVKDKFKAGYPKNNLLFWQPKRIILYQNNKLVFDEKIDNNSDNLVQAIKLFFEHSQPEIEAWDQAAIEFGDKVKELAKGLLELIANQKKTNKKFIDAFSNFTNLCKQAINPNISELAVEEMLIQHFLTERIFRRLFNNPDFVKRNIIASEIEKVIEALTSKSFNRDSFLQGVDYFYKALENTASTITEYSEKQDFLNTVYEKFFQGFAVKVADTHGIVYTPQPIVDFMVKSVEEILQKEFKKSLSDKGVHILDPFVGTGNFIMRIMKEMRKTSLSYKYKFELHCNEVMLLPYYLASMNIEHEYYNATGEYLPFEGICFVDTFEVIEEKQLSLFTEENTARVERQKASDIFVIIGNPPYNANQQNEMDLNKNRPHLILDQMIKNTYIFDSKSVARTTRKLLFDPYIKAIKWASERIKKINNEGVIAFVTNNSFIDALAFDGMRKHLEQDFSAIYLLDLGGNSRKSNNMAVSNVFDIRVGVSINIFVKTKVTTKELIPKAKIYYCKVDDNFSKQEKFNYLQNNQNISLIDWQEITPDKKYNWLTDNLHSEFDDFIPMGSKESKASNNRDTSVIFKTYALGISTNKDSWLYNYSQDTLAENVKSFCETYNRELYRWKGARKPNNLMNFLTNDEKKIKWSSLLIDKFKRERLAEFDCSKIRKAIYRPFSKTYVYFDELLIDAPTLQKYFFPSEIIESENQVICLTGNGSEKPFMILLCNNITDLHLNGAGCSTQCFSFYTYNKDGTNRQENITDWALKEYQNYYKNEAPPAPLKKGGVREDQITKWDIFYYTYAILHHPVYRNRYQANLKKELPRIPFAPEFFPFVIVGKQLADLHLNYEKQAEYPLKYIENDSSFNKGGWGGLWRVEKMKLTKDKTSIIYNEFLTLTGIPQEVFEYKLGNRSALDWIIDQYQIKTDKRSGIINDPNRLEDEQYIVKLIRKIITISLETVKIVNNFPDLGLPID